METKVNISELAGEISSIDLNVLPASRSFMLVEDVPELKDIKYGTVQVIGIGGTNLRLNKVIYEPSGSIKNEEIFSAKIPVSEYESLFDYSVNKLLPYLDNNSPVAISWSFPLDHGRIVCMGKQFSQKYNNLKLEDCFNTAFRSNGCNLRVASVTHDGTSLLVAGMHTNESCKVALTLGTGVNINLIDKNGRAINTEVGSLGCAGFLSQSQYLPKPFLSKFQIYEDIVLNQPFEAQVGGLHIGHIVSLRLKRDISTELAFDIAFGTSNTNELSKPEHEQQVAYEVIETSAALTAAALFGFICGQCSLPSVPDLDPTQDPNQNNTVNVCVAFTGSIISQPNYLELVKKHLEALEHKGFRKIHITLAPQLHGSEVGAGLCALGH